MSVPLAPGQLPNDPPTLHSEEVPRFRRDTSCHEAIGARVISESPLWRAILVDRGVPAPGARQPVDHLADADIPTRFIPFEVAAIWLGLSEEGLRTMVDRLGLPYLRMRTGTQLRGMKPGQRYARVLTEDVVRACARERLRHAQVRAYDPTTGTRRSFNRVQRDEKWTLTQERLARKAHQKEV